MTPPLWLDECICVRASVRVDYAITCFLYGQVTFGKYAWRFTATDLFDPAREFHIKFKLMGQPKWEDSISLPRNTHKHPLIERRPITRILAELVSIAFGRSETALTDQEVHVLYLESDILDACNTTAEADVWVHAKHIAH